MRVHGSKLIDLIFKVDRFKLYAGGNQSLQILDNESRVLGEDVDREIEFRQSKVDIHKKAALKDMNASLLSMYISNRQENEAIEFLKTYKPTDLFFFKGSRGA